MSSSATLTIRSDLEPHQTVDACGLYAMQLATGPALTVDFDTADPNIFALQIALSCRHSLTKEGRFAGFGPLAQQSLGNLVKHDSATEARNDG